MMVKAAPLGWGSLACDLSALLTERDILQAGPDFRNADLRIRIEALRDKRDHLAGMTIDRQGCERVRRAAAQWKRQLQLNSAGDDHDESAGILLAFAYPDRIAQRVAGSNGRYRLASGRGASFQKVQGLSQEEYLVVAQLDGTHDWANILLAVPLKLEELETYCAEQIQAVDVLGWNERSQSVRARRQRKLGHLILDDRGLHDVDRTQVLAALLFGLRRAGMACLPWTKELRQWRRRIALLRRVDSAWPDLSDQALEKDLEWWLGPYLDGLTDLAQVRRIDLRLPLESLLTRQQRQGLDRLMPTHLTVPSGSQVRLDYEQGETPVLAVRLQEMFGCQETPRIADGKMPVIVHLLSPAGRPVQVTKDLASFWRSAYQEVKKELRSRYPRHHWPDDPLTAMPTNRTKRRP